MAPRACSALAAAFLLASALSCPAQTLVAHSEITSFSSGLPEENGSSWSRIGTGHALILSGSELLLNDNSTGHLIAYQGLLGRIEATHDVVVRAALRVISNLGGDGALIEISRPGMELLVQLFPEGVMLFERDAQGGERWLGSADVDLSDFRELLVHKTSKLNPGGEQIIVSVDGSELMRVAPHEAGGLDLGRVLFGSIGYEDYGATIWKWIEVDVHLDVQKTPTTPDTVGRLKGRFQD